MGSKSSIRLVIIGKGNNTQLASTKNGITIDILSTSEGRAIKRFCSSNGEVDNIDVINTNSTKISKSAKSKDLIWPKEPEAGFFILEVKLTFIE